MSWVGYALRARSASVHLHRFRRELTLLALVLAFLPGSAFAGSANVRFSLPSDPDVDFFRIYVGVRSRSYENRFDIRQPALGSSGQASAMQDQLALALGQPQLFFLAMTTVDLKGQESGFSNEIMVDLRGSDLDGDGVLDRNDNCPRTANSDQADRGGVASSSDAQGAQRDGIGDKCQCGDLDGSGTVTERDAQIIELMGVVSGVQILAGGTVALGPPTCNVAGSAACDPTDAQAIRAAVTGRGSLPQACTAATGQTPRAPSNPAPTPAPAPAPGPQSNRQLATSLAMQCPAVERGENRDPRLVQFCAQLRSAIVEEIVRSLAQQCPAVARGQVRDPAVVSFCRQLTQALAAGR